MTIRSISDVLQDLAAGLSGEKVTIGDIVEALHERGFGFLLLIFALPMALPVPVPPGINVMLATPLVLLTAQQALGRHTIWMPGAVRRKSISRAGLTKMIGGAAPWMRRLEALSKPRLGPITRGWVSNLIGIFGLIMALTVMIPVPMTNTVPSLGIALMAVGVIMRDGLAVLAGALIGGLWVGMLIFVTVFLGAEGLDMVTNWIKSVF